MTIVPRVEGRPGWIDPTGLGEFLWQSHCDIEVRRYSVIVTGRYYHNEVSDEEIEQLLTEYLEALPPTNLVLTPVRNADGNIEIVQGKAS